MKRYLYNALSLLLVVLGFASCKKEFLEIVPKGQILASKLKDYDGLMNHTDFYGTRYGLPGIVMGDEVAAETGYFSQANVLTQRGFTWSDVIFDVEVNALQLETELKNLYVCNKIINEVPSVTDGTESERKNLRAEALANRAWIYFGLMNHYAKPYFENTASKDPGFPIILMANLSEKSFTRNSVAEVYQQMIADLQAAIPDLKFDTEYKTRMTRQAAEAMLGKIFFFMGKYQEALVQFDAAFADMSKGHAVVKLYDYNEAFTPPSGAFLPMGRFGPNYPGNNVLMLQEALLHKSTNVYGDFSNMGIVMTPKTMGLYLPSDFRLNFYSQNRDNFTPLPPGLFCKNATSRIHTGVELSDLLLLRAETKARMNNLPGAKEDLELLRKNRMPIADAAISTTIANDQVKLIKFIIDERIREFAGESQRWLDMRRLSVDPLFSADTYTHVVYAEDGTITNTYRLRPERFTLRLPRVLLKQNPGMTDNP